MKKIPTLFQRNYDGDYLVRDEVTPGCEWVLSGEGVATEKFDGTCCLWKDGRLWKRFDRKGPKRGGGVWKPAPPSWMACESAPAPHSRSWPGWVPVGDGPEDKYYHEIIPRLNEKPPREDSTWEFVGPKVNGNPHGLTVHALWPHGDELIDGGPERCYAAIREYLLETPLEGIVWHHPDGRRAKIKRRDFGFEWPIVPQLTDAEADA